MTVDALVNELIALGTLDDTTVTELKAMQEAAAAGTLDPDDEAYIRALHARLTGAAATEAAADDRTSNARLDGHSIEEWRDRALRAEAELADLRDQLASAPTS